MKSPAKLLRMQRAMRARHDVKRPGRQRGASQELRQLRYETWRLLDLGHAPEIVVKLMLKRYGREYIRNVVCMCTTSISASSDTSTG